MTDANKPPPHPRNGLPGWALLIAAAAVVAALAILIRAPDPGSPPAGPGGWLTGSDAEKFDHLAAQMGGFGVTMWEVGHRYRELAWAGEIGDWAYAAYQLEHLEEALWDGVDRRPAYEETATAFIRDGAAPLREILAENPEEGFVVGFQQLTAACIRCHQQEDAPILDLNRWLQASRLSRAAGFTE